jgi:hypothetical protein
MFLTRISGNLETLQMQWRCAKKAEIKTDELLAQTGDGYTAFQMAAENNNMETSINFWSWLNKRN